jgi:hypothetical protein
MVHCCIIKADIGLMMVRSQDVGVWNVQGFHSESEGLRYFESSYNRNHGRSYEASMSALLNGITFQPSIVSLPLEDIEPLFIEKRVTTVRNVSGSMNLVMLKPEADKLWQQGKKPSLISQ